MVGACFCGHGSGAHEMNGACTFRGCKCWHYDQLSTGQGHLRTGIARVAADYAKQRKQDFSKVQRQLMVE